MLREPVAASAPHTHLPSLPRASPLLRSPTVTASSKMAATHSTPLSNGAATMDGMGTSTNGNQSPQPYQFPESKLKKTLEDPTKTPLVLVACGSFSPITYLHMRMFEMAADFAKSETQFELVGSYASPVADAYKKSGLASADHRINMCQLAAEQADRLMVDSWEADQKEYTRTAVVLDRFEHEINVVRKGIATSTGERKQVQISLLAGADLIGTMSTPGVWSKDDLDHILGRYGAFIIERSGTDLEEALTQLREWQSNIYIIPQLIKNDVSSTKIRSFFKNELSVRYLIPPAVIEYIEEHSLYDHGNGHKRSRSAMSGGAVEQRSISPTINEQLPDGSTTNH